MANRALAIKLLELMERAPRAAPPLALNEMSRGEMFILNYLHGRGEPLRPGAISEAMHTSTARTSAALGNMERKGWVRREPDGQDHRQTWVHLTAAGKAHIQEVRDKALAEMMRVLEELGEADATEYLRILERMMEIAARQRPDQKEEP